MEKLKYTPGPWTHGHYGLWSLWVGPSEKEIRVAAIAWDGVNSRTEARENARLIAAAPELLEACQHLLAPFENMVHYLPIEQHKDARDRINKARAAIAKAEGDEPRVDRAKLARIMAGRE
jgi:hypothetical protein